MAKDFDFYNGVKENIDKYGVSLTSVFDPDDAAPPFTYSIGMSQLQLPELIIQGLPPESSAATINLIHEMAEQRSFDYSQPCIVTGLLEGGYKLAFMPVDERCKKDYTIQVGRYYNSEHYDVVQIVVPDRNNLFPWEEGFEVESMPPQGDLFVVPDAIAEFEHPVNDNTIH